MRLIDADAFIAKCGHWYTEEGTETGYIGELKHLIEKQPTVTAEPNWIPVTEKLPKDDTVVLVCGKSGGVYTAIHNNSKTWIRGWWKINSKNHHCNPTAWIPLPQPYKWKE